MCVQCMDFPVLDFVGLGLARSLRPWLTSVKCRREEGFGRNPGAPGTVRLGLALSPVGLPLSTGNRVLFAVDFRLFCSLLKLFDIQECFCSRASLSRSSL